MGEPGAVMIALGEDENLRLVLEPAERGGVNDAVAVAAEGAAALARRLRVQPAATACGIARIRRADYAIHRHRSVSPPAIDLGPTRTYLSGGAAAIDPIPQRRFLSHDSQ